MSRQRGVSTLAETEQGSMVKIHWDAMFLTPFRPKCSRNMNHCDEREKAKNETENINVNRAYPLCTLASLTQE